MMPSSRCIERGQAWWLSMRCAAGRGQALRARREFRRCAARRAVMSAGAVGDEQVRLGLGVDAAGGDACW